MTTADIMHALAKAAEIGVSSATLDLGGGRTKVFVIETDEHLSSEAMGGGRRRTLLVLDAMPAEAPVETVAEVGLRNELAELLAKWKKAATARHGKQLKPGIVYQRCALELETMLMKG